MRTRQRLRVLRGVFCSGTIVVGLGAVLGLGACSAEAGPISDGERVGTTQSALTASATYANGAPIAIGWTTPPLSGGAQDWIALANPADPDPTHFLYWKYTGGGASGTVTFTNAPPGTYVARAYNDWPTGAYVVADTSASFSVEAAAGTPVIDPPGTPPGTVGLNAPVVVAYHGMPGYPSDWVAVATQGSPTNTFKYWAYTNGKADGSVTFSGLPTGSYEARAYANWAGTSSYSTIATAAFTVGAAAAAPALTAPANVAANGAFNVDFSGFPGNASDWVAVAPLGSPASAVTQFKYTNGAASGTLSFNGLPAGNYVARAYFNWAGTQSYTVQTRRAVTSGTGLSRYYAFDGNTSDASLNAVSASALGAMLTTDRNGGINRAYDFDGASTRIVASGTGLPIGSSARTISAWINMSSSSAQNWGVIHWGTNDCTGNMSGLGVQGGLAFWGGCADINSSLGVSRDAWHFVSVSYAPGGQTTLRVDGTIAAYASPGVNTLASNLFIGAETTNNSSFRSYFRGKIDEVRIYNSALTAAETEELRLLP